MTHRCCISLVCSVWIATIVACGGTSAPEPAAVPPAGTPETANTQPTDEPTQVAPSTESASGELLWPQFHGPNGDNLSSDTGLMKQWPEDGPALIWTCDGLGNGYSSISIGNGMIYTAGNLEKQTVVTAMTMDGKIQWQVPNGDAWETEYPGTRSTPTLDGDRLYHQSPLGNLICLDAVSGDKQWSVNILERFGAKNNRWALAESVTIDGDHVICAPGGPKTAVAALDKMTGDTVWQSESAGDAASYATANVIEYQGLRIVLTMNAKAFIGVNADTGKLLFRYPFETEYDINALKPIFHDGQIFISSGYGKSGMERSQLLKLTVSGDDATVEKVWGSTDLDSQHGGVILLDGYLYGSSHRLNNGKWICLEWSTGELQWAERGVGSGSSTYADGMLYLLSERGNVGLLQATPESFQLVSQFRLPPGGQGRSWAHPVVCGGRLYIRHDTKLYAYDVKQKG